MVKIDCEKDQVGACWWSMKTTAIITATAPSSFLAMGAMDNTTTPGGQDATAPSITCSSDGSGASCDETYWINVDTMTLAAANGDPIAQYAIAYITENGVNGTKKDPEKAEALYAHALPGLMKAAKGGNPTACRALAHMYEHGKGVDKDEEKAQQFMEQCKENGGKEQTNPTDSTSTDM